LLAKLLRKAATKLAQNTVEPGMVIEPANLREYLGRPRFTPEAHERTSVPGVATGSL
jgi:ATP-dependent Lon protease